MSAVTLSARPQRRALCTAALAALAVVVQLHGLDALKAAGLVGTAPTSGAGVFKSLIGTLQQNAVWLIITGMGLAFTIVALMYFVGSIRAPDYLLKIAGAIAVILVIGPAVVS